MPRITLALILAAAFISASAITAQAQVYSPSEARCIAQCVQTSQGTTPQCIARCTK